MLSDANLYEIIENDPTKRLTNDLQQLLSRWKKKDFIDAHTYRKILTTDGVLPRVYGLSKIHKNDNTLQIIVSSVKILLYVFFYMTS